MKSFPHKTTGYHLYSGGLAPEGSPLALPLLSAIGLPVFIGLLKPEVVQPIWRLLCGLVLFTVPVLICAVAVIPWRLDKARATLRGRFVFEAPFGKRCQPDDEDRRVPVATISLIVVNTVLFFMIPVEIIDRPCFLPDNDIDGHQIFLTTVGNAFVHADFSHFLGRMGFLWAFGAALELRLGPGRFISAYLLCAIIANLICLNLLITQAIAMDHPLGMIRFRSVGASGAISGLIGIFVVHCHSTHRPLRLPVIVRPLFSEPLRLNLIFLIGLFFASDMAGSAERMGDMEAVAAYWGHLGGYIGGFALAAVFGPRMDGAGHTRGFKPARPTDGEENKPFKAAAVPRV